MIYPLQQTVPGTGAALATKLRRISPSLLFSTGLASQTVVKRVKNVSDWLKTGMPFMGKSRYQSIFVYLSGLPTDSFANIKLCDRMSGFSFVDTMTSFQALFGVNAVQNFTSLLIYKSDLPGLVSAQHNHAQSLLVGLHQRAVKYASHPNGAINAYLWRFEPLLNYNPPLQRTWIITNLSALYTSESYTLNDEETLSLINPMDYGI